MEAVVREGLHLNTRSGNDTSQPKTKGQNDYYPDTPSTSKAAIEEQAADL